MEPRQSTYNKSTKTSTITSTQHNSSISFLIEGFETAKSNPSIFPEIYAAVNLANENKCEYFDSIASYDTEHMGTLLKDQKEIEQKAIILTVLLDFVSEPNVDCEAVIEKIIKKRYNEYFGKLPEWLNNLTLHTIKSFSDEVLSSNLFNGDVALFRSYYKSINKKKAAISDEISARRFLEYISERPHLKTIYGLIGSKHLDMLNKLGELVEKENEYRLIKLKLKDKVIDVHLYGGSHGEMAQYELLASRVKSDGLIVKPTPVLPSSNDDVLIAKLLAAIILSSAKKIPHTEKKAYPIRMFSQPEETTASYSIGELAERFDFWRKTYIFREKNHNKNLVEWLYADKGSQHVNNYKQFCELAKELHKKGYETNPPPTELEFLEGMEIAKEREIEWQSRGYK